MKLTSEQLIILTDIAKNAALKAARLIAEYAQRHVNVEKKAFGESLASQVVTEVDRLSQEIILSELRSTITEYDLGLLTEESEDDNSRLQKDYFWCIDPMDDTLCFTEKRPGYSVSIGLISSAGVSQLGVVVNPVDQSVYYAIKGEGAFKNEQKIQSAPFNGSKDKFTLICDQGFMLWNGFENFSNSFKSSILGLGYKSVQITSEGGAVMSALKVLDSHACYFKLPKITLGGGSFWDYAATSCVFNELGAIACNFRKSRLSLNKKENVYMNTDGIIYCTDEQVRDVLIEVYHQSTIK